jgi:Tol biopolymer transport system component
MNRRLLGMCLALVAAYGCQQIAGLDEFESAGSAGSVGGSASGGVDGSAGEGGAPDGGSSGSTGGKSSGGSANTGGDNTGGGSGGDNTGGASTGGANTGGANTGGDNTGGDNTGGAGTGGETGGTNTGGAGTGGDNTGGGSTGGNGTGGGTGACATNNGGCDENADCTDNGSGAVCTCQPAYLGSGDTCAARTERVGTAAFDPPPVAFTGSPVVSRDGRFVAFSSTEPLVASDTDAKSDIYVRNLLTGAIELVSLSNTEVQANGACRFPSISGDGRYVVFSSIANNLVPGDTNGFEDVFIRDRTAGTTLRVSVASNGTQGDALALMADVSDNGRYVVFASDATNLVTGDTNGSIDIFLRDVTGNTTTRQSVLSNGTQASGDSTRPAISADGNVIVFESLATMGLVDAGGAADVFVRNVTAGTTTRVSVSSSGAQSNGVSNAPAISGDGNVVAFYSLGTNLVTGDTEGNGDVFVRNLTTSETTRVSVSSTGVAGDDPSASPSLSTDGRYVAFSSIATNLVSGDTNAVGDIFVFDRQSSSTARVSVSGLGVQADGRSRYPSISGDGRVVAFDSAATNLVSDDTNGLVDLFVRRLY